MKMLQKITPLPWRFEFNSGLGNEVLVRGNVEDGTFAFCNTKNERDYIVLACNLFPELVAACKSWDEGFIEGEQFTPEQFRIWVNERRRMARAVLAKIPQ